MFTTSHHTQKFERSIWSVTDFMDDDRSLLDYEQFCVKQSVNPSKSDFMKLQKALPKEFVFLTKNTMTH